MTRILTIILLCASASLRLSAANIYVSQNGGVGTNDVVTWNNLCVNGTPGTINDGDEVHLIGTITTNVFIYNHHNYSIVFDTDAKISMPSIDLTTIGNGISAGATPLALMCQPYGFTPLRNFTIDGGSNGRIECTDNGIGLGHTNTVNGIAVYAENNVTIKNMNLINLYVRTYDTNQCDISGSGIYVTQDNTTNTVVSGCNITNIGNAIYCPVGLGNTVNPQIFSNNVSDCNWGIACYVTANGGSLDGLQVWNNHINAGTTNWLYCPGPFHGDGIITGITGDSSHCNNTRIFGNYFGGDIGLATAHLFFNNTCCQETISNSWVYNNVFFATTTNATGQFAFAILTGIYGHFYNNTITNATASGIAINIGQATGANGPGYNWDVKNNLVVNSGYGIYLTATNQLSTNCDFNVWYAPEAVLNHNFFSSPVNASGNQPSLVSWSTWTNQVAPYEGHSITNNPMMNGWMPTIALTGTNLSNMGITNDILGNPRTAWTIGAFELMTNAPAPVPPSITVQPTSVTGLTNTSLTISITATGDAPLAYALWWNSNTVVSAANSFSTNSATAGTGYGFWIVSNAGGAATSTVAAVTWTNGVAIGGGTIVTNAIQVRYKITP